MWNFIKLKLFVNKTFKVKKYISYVRYDEYNKFLCSNSKYTNL